MIKFLSPILIILALIAGIFFLGKDYGKSKELAECQNQKELITHEIIKDKKIISQRQAEARAVSTNDNLVWLRQHRCKDCKGR